MFEDSDFHHQQLGMDGNGMKVLTLMYQNSSGLWEGARPPSNSLCFTMSQAREQQRNALLGQHQPKCLQGGVQE